MAYSTHAIDISEHRARILDVWSAEDRAVLERKYDWIYRRNPAGAACTWVLRDEQSGRDVGTGSYFPRWVLVRGRRMRAAIAGDLFVQRERRQAGPALQLKRAVVEGAWANGVDFLYGFPNLASEPVLRRVGYRALGPRARYVRVLRSAPRLSAMPAGRAWGAAAGFLADRAMALADRVGAATRSRAVGRPLDGIDDRFDALWTASAGAVPILGERDASYLRWRYGSGQTPHGFFGLFERKSDRLLAALVYREQGLNIDVRDVIPGREPAARVALLGSFALWARAQGAATLTLVGLRSEGLERTLPLARLGFVRRSDPLRVYVLPSPSLGDAGAGLSDPRQWMLLQSDDDQP